MAEILEEPTGSDGLSKTFAKSLSGKINHFFLYKQNNQLILEENITNWILSVATASM